MTSDTVKACPLDYRRGWFSALDHICHFINALDSGDMDGRQVRSAIYGECLRSVPANTPPDPEMVARAMCIASDDDPDRIMYAYGDDPHPIGPAWTEYEAAARKFIAAMGTIASSMGEVADALLDGTLSITGYTVRVDFENRDDAERMFNALGSQQTEGNGE